MSDPRSTYRLQIRAEFTLDDAAEQVDYLHALGVDWVYLSPLLTATAGSDHGYDVLDHSEIDPARGGSKALRRLSRSVHALGMGVMVDIVPNHVGVAVPRDNAWWWTLLKRGRDSHYADAFDIDWDFGNGRLRLPVLGDDSQLSIVDGELVCDGVHYPLAWQTADDGADVATIASRQHYELIHWRLADTLLNYRRFFAINSLAGIRVEVPWVFERSHSEIIRWFEEGLVDASGSIILMVSPTRADTSTISRARQGRRSCLSRRSSRVSKNCRRTGRSPARPDTTRSPRSIGCSSTRPGGAALERLSLGDDSAVPVRWSEVVHDSKRAVADTLLRTEILRIDRELPTTTPMADALAEVAACLPVYRTYLPFGAEHLRRALDDAKARRPDLAAAIDELAPLLSDSTLPAARRFQQTSGMIMAKGVEDSAFYRYSRLASLTEVGGDPGSSRSPSRSSTTGRRTGQRRSPLP